MFLWNAKDMREREESTKSCIAKGKSELHGREHVARIGEN